MDAPTSTKAVVETVRSLAAELGLEASPVVVADRSNLVLALDPHPVVARVAMATSAARIGMTWLEREVSVARFLDARGVAVTRPSGRLPAGPFERGGLVVSFWEKESLTAERASPADAGAALAAAHHALAAYDRARLPVWGAWHEAGEVLARARRLASFEASELTKVERAWERAARVVDSAEARSASFQAVHGDAHIGNVLATSRGAVWTDWEDAFVGPVEYDVACLRSKADLFGEESEAIAAMTAAYGEAHAYDTELARELGLVRNVQVVVWLALFAERQPELLPRMRARIARLP